MQRLATHSENMVEGTLVAITPRTATTLPGSQLPSGRSGPCAAHGVPGVPRCDLRSWRRLRPGPPLPPAGTHAANFTALVETPRHRREDLCVSCRWSLCSVCRSSAFTWCYRHEAPYTAEEPAAADVTAYDSGRNARVEGALLLESPRDDRAHRHEAACRD